MVIMTLIRVCSKEFLLILVNKEAVELRVGRECCFLCLHFLLPFGVCVYASLLLGSMILPIDLIFAYWGKKRRKPSGGFLYQLS